MEIEMDLYNLPKEKVLSLKFHFSSKWNHDNAWNRERLTFVCPVDGTEMHEGFYDNSWHNFVPQQRAANHVCSTCGLLI
jgi:hypothetical protein